jgi:hypothetical protein
MQRKKIKKLMKRMMKMKVTVVWKPSVGHEKIVLSKCSLLRNILISTMLFPKNYYDVPQTLNFS